MAPLMHDMARINRPILVRTSSLPLVAVACALLAVAQSRAQAPVRSAPVPSARESDPEALVLLSAVEKRYKDLASLTCGFSQSFRSAATGQSLVEEGRIWIKRPGHMRWDYRGADKKVFLVEPDGTTLSYVQSDMTAVRDRLPAEAPHLRLLLGTGNLGPDFIVTTVKLKDPVQPSSRCLKLEPRAPMGSLMWAYLEIDPARDSVIRVLTQDSLENESDLVLTKVHENATVKNDVFRLELPRGITVRDATGKGAR